MVKSPLRHRPRPIVLTIWLFLFLSLINLWRAAGLGRQRELLQELGAAVQPVWLLAGAILWAGLFGGSALAIWQRWPPARLAAPLLLLLYALYQLALAVFVTRSAVAQQGWPAAALLYILALLFTTWALNRPANLSYFTNSQGEKAQSKIQNPKSKIPNPPIP